jgi:predicted hydrocarbon binding protein
MVFESKKEEVSKIHDFYFGNSRIDYNTGEFYIVDVPAMLIRRETFYNLWQEVFKALGKAAYTVMYNAGTVHGKEFFSNAKKWLSLTNMNAEAIKEAMNFLCCENVTIGFGAIRIEIYNKEVVVINKRGFPIGLEIHERTIADKDFVLDGEVKLKEGDVKMSAGVSFDVRGGDEISPTADSYFLGYFAGFLSMLYKISKGKEVECVARGDKCCRFVYALQQK